MLLINTAQHSLIMMTFYFLMTCI